MKLILVARAWSSVAGVTTGVRRYGHRDVTFDNGRDDPEGCVPKRGSAEYTTSMLTSGKDAVYATHN
jgi:hypothetical protein